MKRTTLPNTVGYRVSEEQWRRLEEEAEKYEISVHDWCREAALEKLKNLREVGEKSTPAETGNGTGRGIDAQALLEEIAGLRYLIEHGFGIQLSADKTSYREWVRRVKETKPTAALLVRMMLEDGRAAPEWDESRVDSGRLGTEFRAKKGAFLGDENMASRNLLPRKGAHAS